jgi:hypothetical protein
LSARLFFSLQTGGDKKSAPKKPAEKSRPSSAASGKSTERVKRVFDMPGQTRDTPGEVCVKIFGKIPKDVYLFISLFFSALSYLTLNTKLTLYSTEYCRRTHYGDSTLLSLNKILTARWHGGGAP